MVTLQEFVKRSGAEMVGGNLIVGSLTDRRIVGNVQDGTYFLNEDGHKILRAMEQGDPEPVKPKAPKRKPTDNAGKTHDEFMAELESLDIE
jgi:hypothetical protein